MFDSTDKDEVFQADDVLSSRARMAVRRRQDAVFVKVSVPPGTRARVVVNVRPRTDKKLLLSFSNGNAKLSEDIKTFSLPSGHSCPMAQLCLAKADRVTGGLKAGKDAQFRCYSASAENRLTSVRESRWRNFDLLRACQGEAEMTDLILRSLSPFAGYVRLHVAGDYFSQDYFDSWLNVARERPRSFFYGYTKSLGYLVKRLADLPDNLHLTASVGGKQDHLIAKHDLKWCKVISAPTLEEAEAIAEPEGLSFDHDDSHAIDVNVRKFALLIHGPQPAGSKFSKDIQSLREHGIFGYGRDLPHNRGVHASA